MIEVYLEAGNDSRGQTRLIIEKFSDAFVEKVKSARTIFLKVNLVHYKYPLACTNVDSVRGAIEGLRYFTGARIFIGDGAYAGTAQAFDALGYRRLVDEYDNVELVDLNEFGTVDAYAVMSSGEKRVIQFSEIASLADVKIVLNPMKVDGEVEVSLGIHGWAMGNWIVPPRMTPEGVRWSRWPWLASENAWAHNATIGALYVQHSFDATILDGVWAMEGEGPIEGRAISLNIVIGGEDPVAVDAVGATLMGVDPSEVAYLAMLGEDRYGCMDLTRINVPPMMMMEHTRQFVRPKRSARPER